MNLVKKITPKGVCGDIKKRVLMLAKDGVIKNGQKIYLMRVVGKATRFDVKMTDLGESIALKGQFKATNTDGEEFRAGVCYLPDTGAEVIAGALAGDVECVEFAFDISVVTDDSAITGYVYEVKPLIEPAEDDALNRLAASLPPALEAPKTKAK